MAASGTGSVAAGRHIRASVVPVITCSPTRWRSATETPYWLASGNNASGWAVWMYPERRAANGIAQAGGFGGLSSLLPGNRSATFRAPSSARVVTASIWMECAR
jgi:hypothetical protein